jgi:cytochrome c-type biogenesis protein CcmF
VLVLVAFIIGLLTAASQFLKYRNTEKKYLVNKLGIPFIIAIIIAVLLIVFYPIEYSKKGPGFLWAIYIALFGSIFSVIANGAYLKTVLKGNLKAGGAAIAHLGFALMLTGMLISSGNRKVISDNRTTGLFIPFDKDPTGRGQENPMENLTLLKSVPTQMGKYTVTYLDDSAASEKNRTFYNIHFQKKDSATGQVSEDFILSPDSYRMKDNNLSSNPGTRHYLTHDVFTYVSTISVKSQDADTAQFVIHNMALQDTAFYSKGYIILDSIVKNPGHGRFHFTPGDTALAAFLTVHTTDGAQRKAYPALTISDQQINFIDDTLIQQNLYLKFAGLASNNKFKIGVKESDTLTDFITLKAYVFPYINLVWIGLLIMAGGFILSIARRAKAANYITALSVIVILGALFYIFLIANS